MKELTINELMKLLDYSLKGKENKLTTQLKNFKNE